MPAVFVSSPKGQVFYKYDVLQPVSISKLQALSDTSNLTVTTGISLSMTEAQQVFNTMEGVIKYIRYGMAPGQFQINGDCFMNCDGEIPALNELLNIYSETVGEPFTVSVGNQAFDVVMNTFSLSFSQEPETILHFSINGYIISSTLSENKGGSGNRTGGGSPGRSSNISKGNQLS